MTQQKIAVITGGTGGLGKAVTKTLIAAGYQTVVTYRATAELEELQQSLGEAVQRLDAYQVDVTDPTVLSTWAQQLESKYGQVNALICLVGGFSAGTVGEDIAERFDKLFSLNTKSFLLTVNALLPLMIDPAAIIAVAAKPALEPAKNLGVYAASKAAVVSLVKTLALELRERTITVNAIAPSTIDTPANRQTMTKADPTKWVTPEELAQAILFLVTQRAVSGTVLPVYNKA